MAELLFSKISKLKDTGIGRTFNQLFGSNTSHISNAYAGSEEILVYVDHLKLQPVEWNSPEKVAEFRRVRRGDFEVYIRDNEFDYLTVLVREPSAEDYKFLEFNYPISTNRSYIVTQDGQVVLSNYEANDIWLDEKGKDHRKKANGESIEIDHQEQQVYTIDFSNANMQNAIININNSIIQFNSQMTAKNITMSS